MDTQGRRSGADMTLRTLTWRDDWSADRAPLTEILCRQGFRFGFFQAVRLLHLLWPDRQPVGCFAAPSDEVVKLRAHLSLDFPASDIMPAAHDTTAGPWVILPPGRDEAAHRNEPAQLTASFGTLTGPAGVLPGHYTTLLLDRVLGRSGKKSDSALRDFLDIFNHRLLSLLYRAWEKTQAAVQLERRLLNNEVEDDFSRYVFSLIGLGDQALRGRQAFSDDRLLAYAGLLGAHSRSAASLRQLIADWLDLSPEQVTIEQFVGAYFSLPTSAHTFLGLQNCLSGEDAIAGDAAWVQDAKFRLRMGPLSLASFAALMPTGGIEGGQSFRALIQLVRFFVGVSLDFDVQLLLAPEDLSRCTLGAEGDVELRVGMTAWLLSDENAPELADTIFAGTLTGLASQPSQDGAFERVQ